MPDTSRPDAANPGVILADSIVAAFWARVRSGGDRPALRSCSPDGRWSALTWSEYGRAVTEVAAGLRTLGIGPGDTVGLLSANRPEWHVADLAIMALGAVSVPVYATSAGPQVAYVLDHAETKVAVVENADQLGKVLAHRDAIPKLDRVVVMSGEVGEDEPFLLAWDRLRALGRDAVAAEPRAVEDVASTITGAQLATLVYTSGTTGPPKGVMLTHHNLTWTLSHLTQMVPISPDDRFLSFLPLSHIAERTVSHFGQIVSGGETWFARSLAQVPEDLQACRPTIFFAVPRVWEKFHERITEEVAEMSGVQRKLVDAYLSLGSKVVERRRHGRRVSPPEWIAYQGLDRVVGAKIRHKLGLDKARLVVSAAAPISPELVAWFHGIGLRIAEVYGQTEDCGPATVNPPDAIRIGTVGVPIPGLRVRIADDGEILVQGESVCAGYYKDPQATAELIDADGWMHTGDVGVLDDQGYLTITDRKKELIINAAGKNISPQQLETRLRLEPLIGQPVVIGDRRPYLIALVTLDTMKVTPWAEHHGKIVDLPALAEDPDVIAEVQAAIDRMNAEHAPVERIRKFRILPTEFTTASGELTPTLKLKRRVVAERYATVIDELYAD